MRRYTLNPAMPVLLRPDGAVQVGWDPRRAVLVQPPAGLSAAALADLLRTLQSGATMAELQARFEVDVGEVVASLLNAGLVTAAERSADTLPRQSASTAEARCRTCWPARCAARAPR